MLKSGNLFKTAQNRRGATAVIVAICLLMLIGFAALAIDIGYISTTKNELQNIADAAALAGAGYLGSEYEKLSFAQQQGKTFDFDIVAAVVKAVAEKNKAAGVNITIDYVNKGPDGDIVIGNWNGSSVDWTLSQPDAVQVTAHRDSTMSNLSTLFARIFRIFGVNVTADATAALTGSTEAEKGELKTPFGVSKCIFPSDCKQLISFSPTTDSCAGWHNFLDHVSAHDMEQKMLGLIKGDGDGSDWDGDGEPDNVCLKDPCGQKWLDDHFDMAKEPDAEVTPGVTAGETQPPFEFQGGDVGSLFLGGVLDTDYHGGSEGTVIGDEKHPAPFPALFDYFRYRDGDNYTDADGVYHNNDNIWTATVPIYKDDACCTNPNGSTPIVEFAKIEITMPNPPPDKTVSVNFTCETSVIQGRGGGGNGNLKGTIPQLVE